MNDQRRFWRNLTIRAALPYVAVAVLLAVAIAVLGQEIRVHLATLEDWIEWCGVWGPIVYVGVFIVLASVFVPDTLLAIIAGALFGIGWGAVAVIAGGLLSAFLQYALGLRLLKTRLERALEERAGLRSIVSALHGRELRMQILLRLTPLSPPLVSYLMGVAGVRFNRFAIACLVMIPSLLVEVYFGYAGRHVASMAGRETGATVVMRDSLILGGLACLIVVMVLVGRAARRAFQEAN